MHSCCVQLEGRGPGWAWLCQSHNEVRCCGCQWQCSRLQPRPTFLPAFTVSLSAMADSERERSPVTASHTLPLRLCSWTVLRIKALLDRHVKSKHASPAQMPTPQSTSVQGVAKPSTQNMYVLCRTSNCCQPARQPKARFCRQRLCNLPRKHFDVSACLALLFCVALFTL